MSADTHAERPTQNDGYTSGTDSSNDEGGTMPQDQIDRAASSEGSVYPPRSSSTLPSEIRSPYSAAVPSESTHPSTPADNIHTTASSNDVQSARLRRPNSSIIDNRHFRAFPPSQLPSFSDHFHGTNSSTINIRDTPTPPPPPSRYPPRHHSHGAMASNFLAQPPEAYGGQTWMDFLRESGAGDSSDSRPNYFVRSSPSASRYTLTELSPLSREPSSATSRASDRRRRLTTADLPTQRPSSVRTHSEGPHGSNADPIVRNSSPPLPGLSGPERPPLPSLPSRGSLTSSGSGVIGERRGSDIMLPPWQPDVEATHCFVCGSQFTFFYRKHHCRKCGRVVCAACSPHRITIPRQFIVHPPSDTTAGANIIDLTGDDENNTMSSFGPFRNPALGGGEIVRVCNPCVPDPNYSPPPPYTPTANLPQRYSSYHPPSTRSNYFPNNASVGPSQSVRLHRPSHSMNDGTQTLGRERSQTRRARDPFSDRRVSFHHSTRVADLWPPPPQPYEPHRQSPAHAQQLPPLPPVANSPHHSFPSRPQPENSELDSGPAYHHGTRRPGHLMSAAQSMQPAPSTRLIAEEDECPICLNELPPKGPNGDTAAREQHVTDCIAAHSSSPPPPTTNQTSTSLPSQRTRGMSTASANVGEGNGEGASNRVSLSRLTMYPYVATEKDCVGEDGEEAECVICLVEFEAGDHLGRLACWCKFHEKCIRDWWDIKGRGACPTHQLHD